MSLGPADAEHLRDLYGEDLPWALGLPGVYRALASPATYEHVLAPPQPGDDCLDAALAYWAPILHLLIYGLGWVRPDRGLQWWYDAGKPLEDPRLRFIWQVWGNDGGLDGFAAWLWSFPATPGRALGALTDHRPDDLPLSVDRAWIETQRSVGDEMGVPSPASHGGSDPLHLSLHCDGPCEGPPKGTFLVRTDRGSMRAAIVCESMVGWYRALSDLGRSLPKAPARSWKVEVFVKPVGWLGTYRRSRQTDLWFSGRHSLHLRGT